jgi:hypothetical protein
MKTKLLAFRCPVELMQRVDAVADLMRTTRSAIVVEAVKLLIADVRSRGGRLVPPHTGGFDLPEALLRTESASHQTTVEFRIQDMKPKRRPRRKKSSETNQPPNKQ